MIIIIIIIVIIIMIIINLFQEDQEDNLFGTYASLTYKWHNTYLIIITDVSVFDQAGLCQTWLKCRKQVFSCSNSRITTYIRSSKTPSTINERGKKGNSAKIQSKTLFHLVFRLQRDKLHSKTLFPTVFDPCLLT